MENIGGGYVWTWWINLLYIMKYNLLFFTGTSKSLPNTYFINSLKRPYGRDYFVTYQLVYLQRLKPCLILSNHVYTFFPQLCAEKRTFH